MADQEPANTVKYETNPFKLLLDGTTAAFKNSQTVAIVLIVATFVFGIFQFVFQIFSEVLGNVFESNNSTSGAVVGVGVLLLVFSVILLSFTQVIMQAMRSYAVIAFAKGQDASLTDIFGAAISKFWKILGLEFMKLLYALPYLVAVVALAIAIFVFADLTPVLLWVLLPFGIPLCIFLIVLAVRVYMRFELAGPLFFSKETSPTISAAMEESRLLTNKRLSEVYGVTAIAAFVPFISMLVTAGGLSQLYSQLSYARQNKTELPKQSLLNYTPLAVGLMLVIFILMLVSIVALSSANSL